MGRKIVDQKLWDKLLEAYREEPGNISRAAKLCGVTRVTARRAWEAGWNDRPWSKVSIAQLIELERDIARSRLELEDEAADLASDKADLEAERDREASRQRSIKTKEEEGRMVQIARNATIVNLANILRLAPAMQKSIERLAGELNALSMQETWDKRDRGEVSSLVRRFSMTVRELNLAGQTAMEMERLFLGQPEKVIGIVTEMDQMPLEELIRSAYQSDAVLKRAASRGLVVIPGTPTKTLTDGGTEN